MFSDKVADKLLKLDSNKEIIREAAKEEVDKLIRSATAGDKSALKAIASLLPEGTDLESVTDFNTLSEGLTDSYIDAIQGGDGKEAAKKKKKSKLREVEERILHFCTRPRISSDVVNIFPARPYNILAIMENLKHKGALILAANHWVTNVENRDFIPTMVMTADKKGAQFESKTAEMWSYSDVESKKRLLSRAKIKATDKYASESWDFLPNWVKKSVAYVHENPAVSIAEKKKAEEPVGSEHPFSESESDDVVKANPPKEKKGDEITAFDGAGQSIKVKLTGDPFLQSDLSGNFFMVEVESEDGESGPAFYQNLNADMDGPSENPYWLVDFFEGHEGSTGEVKKDIPMEITQIQDLDTGEEIKDANVIAEAMTTGMDYIVSFKREGKEDKALLSSLDRSQLKNVA